MDIERKLEAVLFYRSEPVTFSELVKILDIDMDTLQSAIAVLENNLKERGVRLMKTETEVTLVTAPEVSELIETMRRDELKRDIGKAGAETLSIVLYKGPVSRSEIDFIRGVNSSFILRNLLIRGLITRTDDSARSFKYAVTPELLKHLGVTRKEDMPQYEEVVSTLDRYDAENKKEQVEEVSEELV